MTSAREAKIDLRYTPLYTQMEVSRYARVRPATVRTWALSMRSPVIVPADTRSASPLSFVNLVEVHVLRALRQVHRVPLQRIRSALDWLAEKYRVKHPLAEIDLETDGYDVFVRRLQHTVSASERGQIAIPAVVDRYLKRIERDQHNVPVRFFPFPYDASPKIVVMDPSIDFGRPVIAKTRIATSIIFERYGGGEAMKDIAEDYGLDIIAVEEALRCEMERTAA